jgi:hypothetical protein
MRSMVATCKMSMLLLGVLACNGGGSSNPSPVDPGDGNQNTPQGAVIGDDWKSYRSTGDLRTAALFWWLDTSRDVYDFISLVPDPLFTQAVRITFPRNTTDPGPAPRIKKDLPTPLENVWFRWRMKYHPGWTTIGPDPAGHANSYKIAFFVWDGYDSRAELELSNSTQFILGMGVLDRQGTYVNYTTAPLPNSTSFGGITSEWTDSEWYEYIMHYHKLSDNTGHMGWWRRRLSSSGALAPGSWTFSGFSVSGSPLPRVRSIQLGINKNKNNPSDMYIYWGPWEVVDGSTSANPFGVPNGN